MAVTKSEKMIQIITNTSLESHLIETFEKVGVTGYTIFNVRGDGDSGVQDSHIEGDTNILLMVVVPEDISENLMKALSQYIKQKHHLMVFSVNAEVLSH